MSDTPSSPSYIPVLCPIWHTQSFRFVQNGIEIRCKSCRGSIHFVSREDANRYWDELERRTKQEEERLHSRTS